MGWQPHLGRARPDLRRGWCADAELGSNIANQQDQPLALIPVEAIKCTLEQFEQEAADAGAADRLSYDVIGQAPGQPPRDLFGVVVNALETPKQQQASANWFALRDIMLTDPALGQTWLEDPDSRSRCRSSSRPTSTATRRRAPTYFSAVPDDASVDGRYLNDTNHLFLAGLWRDRDAAVANAPVIVHGETTADSRYLGLATNSFSRGDAERE